MFLIISHTQMPGVAAVAGGWAGRDIPDSGHLLSPLSSTYSRPLSHDSAHPGLLLKLKFSFL